MDNNADPTLGDECLTSQEREEKERDQVRATQLHSRIQPAPIGSSFLWTNTSSSPSNEPLSEDSLLHFRINNPVNPSMLTPLNFHLTYP